MRIPRIFVDYPLVENELIELPPDQAHHIARVLRLRSHDTLVLFNGRGGEFLGNIEAIGKSAVQVRVGVYTPIERESSLEIVLVQGISKGERMDYTIQKAVELGVSAIVPVSTCRSTVHMAPERSHRRLAHWSKVMIHACEQCGRNRIPLLEPVQTLSQWLALPRAGLKLLLAPDASASLASLALQDQQITLLIGPESGFSEDEIHQAEAAGYLQLSLGPRVLRTETTALAALAALQACWGDLAGQGGKTE